MDAWLAGKGSKPSRMFVLLADPGMGKSVFSAVLTRRLEAEAGREGIGGEATMVVSGGLGRCEGRCKVSRPDTASPDLPCTLIPGRPTGYRIPCQRGLYSLTCCLPTPAPIPHGTTPQAYHFFKVGEQRAQGRAMVLSLALQLARALPALRPHLSRALEAVEEEGKEVASLTLTDLAER